jgi:hypothetical protein
VSAGIAHKLLAKMLGFPLNSSSSRANGFYGFSDRFTVYDRFCRACGMQFCKMNQRLRDSLGRRHRFTV